MQNDKVEKKTINSKTLKNKQPDNSFNILKYTVLLFFCIVINLFSSIQAQIDIFGSVTDATTGAPLENANIKFRKSNIGTTTNELGKFRILSNKLPVTLIISHIGFETEFYSVEFEPLHEILIKLKPKTELLKGVVITSQKIDTITKKKYLIHTVKDQEKIDFLNNNPKNFSLLSKDAGPDLSDLKGLPGDKPVLDLIRFIEVEKRFNKMAYFPPMFAPMLKLGDTVCIFNYPESKIEFFNYNDSLIYETKIDFHLTEKPDQIQTIVNSISRRDKWQTEIYSDKKKGKYIRFF
ncbi:MAG: hypothetical protein B6D61_03735 [Bacteroidetes bacterium 4484_249]|nr:MAG: hypothetical protein B6D61_03735 [Bacteroidetes bacterium 4484_249]